MSLEVLLKKVGGGWSETMNLIGVALRRLCLPYWHWYKIVLEVPATVSIAILILSARRLAGGGGLGFGNWLVTRGLGLGYGWWQRVGIIVGRCIYKVDKKTSSSSELGWLSGLGLGLVEQWSWVWIRLIFRIFFLPLSKKFLNFLAG